jgi:hypothetical protein
VLLTMKRRYQSIELASPLVLGFLNLNVFKLFNTSRYISQGFKFFRRPASDTTLSQVATAHVTISMVTYRDRE